MLNKKPLVSRWKIVLSDIILIATGFSYWLSEFDFKMNGAGEFLEKVVSFIASL
jgi:hypothetical protein